MPSCADVLAATLRDAGVERMFGLPGGEILAFIEAARQVGIEFVLTRHEAVAALMADATGQLSHRPGVCVSTLGPGAMNLTLGVANAWLDRSPMIAITATTAESAQPYATHQQPRSDCVFRPFTKDTLARRHRHRGEGPARLAHGARGAPGPVHLALPSDVATRRSDRPSILDDRADPASPPAPSREAHSDRTAAEIGRARRPSSCSGSTSIPARPRRSSGDSSCAQRPGFRHAEGESILPRIIRSSWRLRRPRRGRRGPGVLQAQRFARWRGLRAGRIRQVVAPHDEARLHRPGVHRRGRLPARARSDGRRRAVADGPPGHAFRSIRLDRCRSGRVSG